MQRHVKILTTVLLAFFIVSLITGCDSSLKKPTGLEDNPSSTTEKASGENRSADDIQKETEKTKEKGKEQKKADKQDASKVKKTKTASKSKADQTAKSGKSAKPANKQDRSTSKEAGKTAKQSKNGTTISNSGKQSPSSKPAQSSKSNTVKKPAAKTKASNGSNAGSNSTSSNKGTVAKADKPKQNKQAEKQKDTVVLSIVISNSEVPLSATKVEYHPGDTVLDALIRVTKAKKIQMDYRGGGSSAYVEGIANVYEFDRGQGSGWMYRVNGIFPNRGAGTVPLQPGDRVEWLYTTNLGKDLGADLKPFR